MELKIQSVKKQFNKGIANIRNVICNLSKTKISPNEAFCLNILNNKTAYASKDYLEHIIFNDLDISTAYKIDLLTLVYLGATLKRKDDILTINTNNNQSTYKITLKNGIDVIIYDNDAKSKKYFNILKNYKASIARIFMFSYLGYQKILSILDYEQTKVIKNNVCSYMDNIKSYYPPYLKKLYDYQCGIGYKPTNKNSCTMYW